jgi:hypothetical protein
MRWFISAIRKLFSFCRQRVLSYIAIFTFMILISPRLHALLGTKQQFLPRPKESKSLAKMSQKKPNPVPRLTDCPYEYTQQAFGQGIFAKTVQLLDPTLSARDSSLFYLILDVMDAIYLSAYLVDDVMDNSALRKGRTAAYHIYGANETMNRAYLRICEAAVRCSETRPELVHFVLEGLMQLLRGVYVHPQRYYPTSRIF